MKKISSKFILAFIILVAVIVFSFMPFSNDNANKTFTPSSSSTWGDFSRFYAPEKFEKFSEDIKVLYDNTPLQEGDTDILSNLFSKEDIVYTKEYLYPKDEKQNNTDK